MQRTCHPLASSVQASCFRHSQAPPCRTAALQQQQPVMTCIAKSTHCADILPTRRIVLTQQLISIGILALSASEAKALGFKKELKKRRASLDEYSSLEDGLQYYDLSLGNGEEAKPGDKVTVHFDCMYKGINVVSTRSARLLGGNRSVAEPFEFTAGSAVAEVGVKKINDSANGLFAGASGPKPPPALSSAVLGMKVGGKRTVNVPADQGYGSKGLQEIPPNATFDLQIELLKVSR